ncbi:MAG: CGNR zinc finger domain-containing protein [Pseudonocardiaceae bacterium]
MSSRREGDVETPGLLLLPDEPVAVRLMNTIWADRAGVHDALDSTGSASAWLGATMATSSAPLVVSPSELERTRRLRDALRRLAAHVTSDERPAAASATHDIDIALAEVNGIAAAGFTAPQLRLRDTRLLRETTTVGAPVPAALATIAANAVDLLTGLGSEQLRACPAPSCVLYFVKNHPRREWCSTACGNRARAARHYSRHHAAHTT